MIVPRKVWSFARWLVVLEIGIWRSLLLWVTRRVSGQGPGVEAFSYAKQITPVIAVFIVLSAIELPVVHILLPWESVRLVVDILSVWALLWMIGLLASMRVVPHLVDDDGLRIRSGTTVDVRVPWEAIATVKSRRGSVDTGKSVHVELAGDATVVSIPVMKLTRVDIKLRRPTTIALPDGPQDGVIEVRCYVDDPRAFIASTQARRSSVGERSSGHDSTDADPAHAARPRPDGADPRAERVRRR